MSCEHLNSLKVGVILFVSKHLEHNDSKTTENHITSKQRQKNSNSLTSFDN